MRHASKAWPEIRAQLDLADQILLLCDYDGTLVPIVSRPQDAVLSPKTKQLLAKLAKNPKLVLGILSGRPLAQIKRLVGLKKIIYAGNHGLEIACAGTHFIHPKAARSQPLLTHLSRQLKEQLDMIPGTIVEDKGLTLSVHYRRVANRDLPRLKKLLAKVIEPLKAAQKVKLTAGKKVWEVKPPVAWDKGQAVLWIIKTSSQVAKDNKTFVRPFPISIDAAAWSQLAASPQVEEALKALPTEIDPPYEILAVGLDRIDYIKGVIEKLKAIDRFLEKYPQYKGRFIFLQSLARSRLHLKPYKQVIDEVQSLKEELNWKHGVGNWYPVVLIVQNLDYGSPKHLALFRAADLFIVGSLHEGMNLTAKEFVMANVDQKGMLILSQWTGSARELKEAVLINPYDTDGFADAIAYAIEMPADERRERIRRMQQTILENNIYRWAGKFIEELVKLK